MDDFEFNLTSDFKGYNSTRDKTNISDNYLVRGSKNVYKKLSGTIASRPGLLRRGVADSTVAGITSSYEWSTSLGATRPLRVVSQTSALNDGKLQVEFNQIWYDLVITSTLINPAVSLSRFIFDAWWNNTEKKDRIIFVRGDSNLFHWSGGICSIESGTINTITKSDTSKTWAQEGFASTVAGEKKIVINGTEYTYTGGENTTTLTGVTPDASAITLNQVAVQSVMVETNKPATGFNNDFIKIIGNQLYVGSYTSRLVYISSTSDFTDFTVPTPRVSGSPELLTLDNAPTGISVRQGNAHISAGLSDWYIIKFEQITVGTTLTEKTTVDKQKVANLSAALAHEFIDTVGDDIVYLSQDQQLRSFGTFRNLFQSKYPSLSLEVQTELEEENFTGGHLRAIGDFIYLTAPASGKDYMHQIRSMVDSVGNVVAERLWHPPQVRNISRFAIIDGVVYGHSNANPQIYQVWDTGQWHDDSPSDEPLPYECRMKMAYRLVGTKGGYRRQGKLSANTLYTEGYIANGVNLNANLYFDYQGSSGIQTPIINSVQNPAHFYSGTNTPSMGDSSLGDNPLGDIMSEESNDQELLPKFRDIAPVTPVDCFEYQIEIFSTDADSRWEILSLGLNEKVSTIQAVELRQ